MKVKVTNTGKIPVERLGHRFEKDKPQTIEVSDREHKALRAVRALTVEPVTETTKAQQAKEKSGAAGAKAKETDKAADADKE